MTNNNYIFVIMLSLFLQLAVLAVAVLIDSYINREKRKIMLAILLIVISIIAQNYMESYFEIIDPIPFARKVAAIYGYCIRPLLILSFIYMLDVYKRHITASILFVINTIVYLSAFFTDIAFTISDTNSFIRGPLGYTCHIVSGILLAFLIGLSIREIKLVGTKTAIIPLLNGVLIVIAVLLDSKISQIPYPMSFLTITVVPCCTFYYIWLHLRFVREHEEDIKAQQRIKIMMSQIQPHFLYNTLSTVQALCRIDPEKASEVTEKFAKYLRQNLESLDKDECISIKKELEHTRIYSEIEMVRFPQIEIRYDIKDEDFMIPALSIQPMVENAIRHGVRIREHGIVSISTDCGEKFHKIIIKDNGKGFDVKALDTMESSHIGVKNVKERIEKMCGGVVNIESTVGEGTTITIRIPK